MSHWFTPALAKHMRGELDLDLHDVRVAILMTNNTAVADRDAATLAGITTLDEMNGAGYVRKALTGEIVNQDDPNNRAEFDADDVLWSALGNGARAMAGLLVYRHVDGTAANDIPIGYIDSGGFPLNPQGVDFQVAWNVEGILQLAAA